MFIIHPMFGGLMATQPNLTLRQMLDMATGFYDKKNQIEIKVCKRNGNRVYIVFISDCECLTAGLDIIPADFNDDRTYFKGANEAFAVLQAFVVTRGEDNGI